MASRRVLGVIGCAADGVQDLRTGLVEPAVTDGWRVAVTLTPTAAGWLRPIGEIARLEQLTELPVRHQPRLPTEPRPHPDPDCYVIAPATAHTVGKLALGLADNQALTQACEALGAVGLPVVLFPRINAAHARHPAWADHLSALRQAGVELIAGERVWPLYEPRTEPERQPPWQRILAAANRAVPASRKQGGREPGRQDPGSRPPADREPGS